MLMKYTSALLAVAISTMMGTTEAVKRFELNRSPTPLEITSAIFDVLDEDEDNILAEQELERTELKIKVAKRKGEFPVPLGVFKPEMLRKAKKTSCARGWACKDNIVTFDSLLKEYTDKMEGPDLQCFIDPVFSGDSIQTIKNIPYGSAYNTKTEQQQDLMLDAYFPPDSD